ncbi:4340_t:CDS:2, partial [Dentiscutata heterogama]
IGLPPKPEKKPPRSNLVKVLNTKGMHLKAKIAKKALEEIPQTIAA